MNPRTKRRLVLSTALIGTLSVVVVGGVLSRAWYRSTQLAEKRRVGLALFSTEAFAEALEPLAFAARNNEDSEVVLALAECRLHVPESNGRHWQTAASYFRAVLAREQQNPRAMRGLLETYIALGHLPEIPPLVHRLLELVPTDVRAREIELEVLNLTGRFDEAALHARELQKLEPQNGRWRAAELMSLERAGADAEGRLTRVRAWRTDAALAASSTLRLLEADLLREIGKNEEARGILRTLAQTGVSSRLELETLVGAIESGSFETAERDRLVEGAITASRAALGSSKDASEIEGQRLLRAGRLAEIETRFGNDSSGDAAVFRLRYAAKYLTGHRDEAAQLARTSSTRDLFTTSVQAFHSDATAQARIEAIAGPHRACPKDPIVAILLADILMEAGDFDEAQSILVRSFEHSGECFQPVGIRAVRASLSLGRVRDAFRIAQELLVRYGPSGDPSVALLAVEAWAAVLEANYRPVTRGGVFGADSPEALRRYWTALSGPDATHGPASLAPVIADVFVARGDRETARELLEAAIMVSGEAATEPSAASAVGLGRLSRALESASAFDPALQRSILGQLEAGEVDAELAGLVAERLLAQGQREAALRTIDRALSLAPRDVAGDALARRRLERLRHPLLQPDGIAQWLEGQLKSDAGLETASFVLSRPESWSAADDALVRAALEQMKAAIGADSLRVLVAEAAMVMTFHAEDRSRLAASIASLDAAALRSPDSTSVLTTLAALFERQSPPLYERSAKLLARAVQAEPASATVYPQLVNALQQIGDFDGAEDALEAYIRVVGDDLQSTRHVADFKARQGHLAEAAQIRERLVGRSKEVVDAVALARIRQRMGAVAEAAALLSDMRTSLRSSAEPPVGDAYSRELLVEREAALLCARDGRLEEARASLDAAQERLRGPRLDEVRANLELAHGEVVAALRLAEELVAREATGAHELLLARALIRSGDLTRAREALTRSLVAEPDNPDATTVAAALLVGDPSGGALLERSLAAASTQRPDLAASIALLDSVTTPEGRIEPTESALTRAQAMTTEYSGSALAWRVAAQLHLLAERKDDAFRIGQRALSRLPGEESIGKLATETAIAAGRMDEAASSALAWQRMATADAFEVDLARASIELLQRRPGRGFELLKPMAREILTQQGNTDAARTLIVCAVQGGRWSELRPWLETAPVARRGELVGVWIEVAQTLPVDGAMAAMDSIASLVSASTEDDAISSAACIAAWTSLCRAGSSEACVKAETALAAFHSALVPVAILRADLASARGEHSTALALYETLYQPVLQPWARGANLDLVSLARRARNEADIGLALRRTPVAIVALNNAADTMLRAGRDGERAVALASLACAAMPDSIDLTDTLVRALVAARQFGEAMAEATRNPDPVLSAVEIAEIELARQSPEEARRALSRADARVQASFAPSRTLAERMARIETALLNVRREAEASTSRNDR